MGVLGGSVTDTSKRRLIENVLLGSFYARFAIIHAATVARGDWHVAAFVVQETLLAVMFLTRREPRKTSTNPFDWIVAIVGSFAPLMIRPGGAPWMIGVPLQMIGLGIAIGALLTLRRSFGIVAADRGVKTTGLYAIVRHPMYTGHAMAMLGYLATYPSPQNLVIVVVALVALVLRIDAEEVLLYRSPSYFDYAIYAARVRWRLIPRVY